MPIHDWTRVSDGTFHDFHVAWISEIRKALNRGVLPPDYYAQAEQMIGPMGPDVLTLQRPGETRLIGDYTGELATATLPQFSLRASATIMDYARKRRTLHIHHNSDHRIVAVIEIVSPGNKSNRHAFRSFLKKAVDCLDLGLHLMIVDLFPPGPRDPNGIHGAIWDDFTTTTFEQPKDRPLMLVSYYAGLTREAFIEPVAVGTPLRDMPLFLEPDLFVNVPLEATYLEAYDGVAQIWKDVLEAT